MLCYATMISKLYKLVANCSVETANQNINIAAEVCKVGQKRTSGLDCKCGPELLKKSTKEVSQNRLEKDERSKYQYFVFMENDAYMYIKFWSVSRKTWS